MAHFSTRSNSVFRFFLLNFAAPIAFFIVFERFGSKPAIAVAIFLTLVQLAAHRFLREKISPFFWAGTGFTLFFGTTDLVIHNPRYFRLEPFFTNLVLAVIFLVSALRDRPIISWFAEALPSSIRPDPKTLPLRYSRNLTLVWALYLLIKSGIFLYLAFQVNLGNLILLRSFIGGISGALLLGGEVLYRTRFRKY